MEQWRKTGAMAKNSSNMAKHWSNTANTGAIWQKNVATPQNTGLIDESQSFIAIAEFANTAKQ